MEKVLRNECRTCSVCTRVYGEEWLNTEKIIRWNPYWAERNKSRDVDRRYSQSIFYTKLNCMKWVSLYGTSYSGPYSEIKTQHDI